MDPDAAVRRFKKEAGDRARGKLVFPRRRPKGECRVARLLVGLVLLVTVYGGWYYLTVKIIC